MHNTKYRVLFTKGKSNNLTEERTAVPPEDLRPSTSGAQTERPKAEHPAKVTAKSAVAKHNAKPKK